MGAPGRSLVEGGVGQVHILGVHPLLTQAQALAETLEVYDLPLPQEADHVVHIRVIRQAEDIVVGHAGLLFCCAFVRTTFPNVGLCQNKILYAGQVFVGFLVMYDNPLPDNLSGSPVKNCLK